MIFNQFNIQLIIKGLVISSERYSKIITVYNINKKTTIVLTGHTDEITAVCLSPNCNILYSASKDNTIRIWSIIKEKCIKIIYRPPTYKENIIYLAINDKNEILTGTDNNKVAIIDTIKYTIEDDFF
jgi:WD40 repeat protein